MFDESSINQPKSPRQLKTEKHWKEALDFDNDSFREETGVDVYAIKDLRPKMAMLLFWKDSLPEKRQRISNFAKQYGKEGISAFISFLGDEKNNDKILEIGEKADQQDAKKIFSKISEFSVWVDKISNELAGAFFDLGKIADPQAETNKLHQAKTVALESIGKIVSRISEVIDVFHNAISSEKKASGESIDKLITGIDNIKTKIVVLSALLRTAGENKIKLTPEKIRGMNLETYEVGELTGSKKEEFIGKYKNPVMDMMEKSYAKIFENNPSAREKVGKNFENRFKNLENYRVHLLTFQNELVAFMTIHPEGNNEVMAESFIVEPEAQRYSLGIAFARKIMEMESQKASVKIKVRADNEVVRKTHLDMGFTVSPKKLPEEAEVKYIEMKLEKKTNSEKVEQ